MRSPAATSTRMPGTSARAAAARVLPSGCDHGRGRAPQAEQILGGAGRARARTRWSRKRPISRKNSSVTAASK